MKQSCNTASTSRPPSGVSSVQQSGCRSTSLLAGTLAVCVVAATASFVSVSTVRAAEVGSQSQDIQRQVDSLVAKGKLAEAIELARASVAIAEKTFGTNHPSTASALYLLGVVYEESRQFTNAQAIFAKSFEIRATSVGLEAPDTMTSLHMLARVHLAMGELTTAKQLNETCVGLREKFLGPEHPDTAKSLNNLGMVCGRLNDSATEELLYQRSLGIAEKKLGKRIQTPGFMLATSHTYIIARGSSPRRNPVLSCSQDEGKCAWGGTFRSGDRLE